MKTLQLLTMLLFLSVFQTNMSFEMVAAKTPGELYKESDVILVGKITTAKENVEQRVTDYTISVEKYLKNDTNAQSLSVISSGSKNSNVWVEDEPIFDTGDKVLLYLNRDGNVYRMSQYSTVLYDEGYGANQVKSIQDEISSEKLVQQLIIIGSTSSAVIVSMIVAYKKIRKKRK